MADFSGWTDFPLTMLNAEMKPMGEGRPAGLHLGEVIHHVQLLSTKPSEPLRLQEGFLWERVIEFVRGGLPLDDALQLAFKRYMVELNKGLITQISMEKDGIHMTPDAFDPARGELHSYKHTRRSLKKALDGDSFQDEFWTWMMAEKAYCYGASCDTTKFVVLWAAGDYSKGVGTGPRALQCTMRWTAEELMENWRVVLIHAKGLR